MFDRTTSTLIAILGITAITVCQPAVAQDEDTILHVPGQYATIQEAIDACPDGGTIQLAPGDYRETIMSIETKDLRILGSPTNPDSTTIYNDIARRHSMLLFGKDPRRLTIEGLTIAESTLHGISVSGQIELSVIDCIIRDCARAGVMVQRQATGIFRRTSFLRNGDCGIFGFIKASVDAEDCDFIDNVTQCYGGGIGLANSATCHVRRCRFEGNLALQGGAIGLAERSSGHIADCRFASNTAPLQAATWWGDEDSGASCSNSVFCGHDPGDIDGGFTDEGGNEFIIGPCPSSCPGDLNGDQAIGAADLGMILAEWGSPSPSHPDLDLDGDGFIGAQDLGILLSLWGPCPG